MKTKKLRKADCDRVKTQRRATELRRARIAREFRRSLEADVPSPTTAQRALIECCVSAYTQVVELSARFERARTTAHERESLNLARSSVGRILRQLGLVSGPVEPEPEQPGAALNEWAEKRRQRDEQASGGVPVPSGARS